MGIPSSSAAVERFFSICGSVCKKRASNINVELFKAKFILRGNFELVEKLEEVKY